MDNQTSEPTKAMLNDEEGQQLVQAIHDRKEASEGHYFKFSTNWQAGKRLCGTCNFTYDQGAHVEINNLKPFTNYVCPTGGGYGHSSVWTGDRDSRRELKSTRDAFCICGAEYVEVDNEKWKLSWEMIDPFSGNWKKVKVTRSKHDAHSQHEGLQSLLASGEVRNVKLKKKGSK